MNKTEHFELNLVQGSDIVNPLVQDVPNYQTIDTQMYANQSNGIAEASELVAGGNHNIVRTVENASMFRFQAVSNWTAGDTMTVDGINVSVFTVKGERPQTNCYIIGSMVLGCLRGTQVTLYVQGAETADDSNRLGGQLPEYYATNEAVENVKNIAESASTLATQANTSINDINTSLGKIGFNGVKVGHTSGGALTIPSGSTYSEYVINYNTPFDETRPTPHVAVSLSTGTTTQGNIVIPVIYEEAYDHFTVRLWRQVGAPTSSNPQPAITWIAYQE